MKFKQFLETETPAQAFARMRAEAGFTDRKPVTAAATQPLPANVMDILKSGFQNGGTVPPQIMRYVKPSMVGDNSLLASPTGPYPFVKEKMAGAYTGRVKFVQHFPLEKFVQIMQSL